MNHFFTFHNSKQSLLNKFKLWFPRFLYIKNLDVFFYADPNSGIWKKDFENLTLMKMIKTEFPKRIHDEFQTQISKNENIFIKDFFLSKDHVHAMLKWLKQPKYIKTLINKLKKQNVVNDLSHFNINPNLILFKNDVVFDLKSKKIIKVNWSDMIANNQQLNVSFESEDVGKIATIAEIFNEIIVNDESKLIFVKYLFQSLFGIKSKQIMLNIGGNYKTIIMDVFVKILGNYAIKCDEFPTILQWEQARVIVTHKKKVNLNPHYHAIRDVTGGQELPARRIYESDKITPIKASYFANCDEIINEESGFTDYATRNRTLKTQFKADTDVKFEILIDDKFVPEYGTQFIHYLLKFCD